MSTLFPITSIRNNLDREFDTLINSFFGPTGHGASRFTNVTTTPRANVLKESEGYMIELAAPGFSRDEFDIGVDNGILSIHVGTSDNAVYSENLTSQEFSYASFTRSWTLPKDASSEAISARYDAGILYVNIPTSSNTNNKIVIDVE